MMENPTVLVIASASNRCYFYSHFIGFPRAPLNYKGQGFYTYKVGKTTRPFKYDLKQTPYDYRVEVKNRLKGLDLINRMPDELWTEVCDIVRETGIKTIPMEKKCNIFAQGPC